MLVVFGNYKKRESTAYVEVAQVTVAPGQLTIGMINKKAARATIQTT